MTTRRSGNGHNWHKRTLENQFDRCYLGRFVFLEQAAPPNGYDEEHWKGKRNGRALTAEGHATEDPGDIITKAKYELELQAGIDDHAADKNGAKKLQVLTGGCSEHGKPKQDVRLVRYAEEDSGWVMVEQDDAPPADDDGAQPSMVRTNPFDLQARGKFAEA